MASITGRRFANAAPAREVIHAMRARIAVTVTIARNKAGRAVSADRCVKEWELVADKLSKAGWSLGCVSALDCEAQTISSWTPIVTTESVSLRERMKS